MGRYIPSLPTLVVLSAQLLLSECQTSGRVIGIGIGTFIIILAILFSIIWCLACRTSSRPEIYSAAGILIPLILILIFVFMPKEKDRLGPIEEETDMNFVTHTVFMVVSIVGFVLAVVFLFLDYMFTEKKAKNIARSAFVRREEEDELLGKRSRSILNSRQGSEEPLRPPSSQSNL
jgi:amino acid transporter